MKISNSIETNYKRFCHLEGSEYIATSFALSIIINLIEKFQLRSVLELGLGIGAIADTVMKFSKDRGLNIRYVGTENNEYCKKVLKDNVEYYSEIEQYNKLKDLGENIEFDLIIIDGLDENLRQIKKYCKKRTIIFIEGDRSPQADIIMSIFPKAKHVNIISLEKNKEYSKGNPNFFIGGGRVIFTNPNFQMNWFYWSARISTYIKRIIRNYL